MKKVVLVAVTLVFSVSMIGCSTNNTTEPPTVAETKTVSQPIPQEQFLSEIQDNIVCLNSCAAEIFGADVNLSEYFLAAYKDEAAFNISYEKPELLFPSQEIGDYKDYYLDPSETMYYPVNNYKTNNDVQQYLYKYLSADVAKKWFNNDFLEYNEGLYLRRGGRGYGAQSCDAATLKFIGVENGVYSASIDWLLFDKFDHIEILKFEAGDGHWILIEETVK